MVGTHQVITVAIIGLVATVVLTSPLVVAETSTMRSVRTSPKLIAVANANDEADKAGTAAKTLQESPRAQDSSATPRKAPFRVLFSNDCVNMVTMTSPFLRKGKDPLTDDTIRASVDETADYVDVHMLQPGGGRTPWWKSEIAPPNEYYRWIRDNARVNLPKGRFGEYFLRGGDVVQVFVDQCRKRGITPFISLRLNDYHGTENADLLLDRLQGGDGAGDTDPGMVGLWLGRFYLEHPEYRIRQEDHRSYANNPDKLVFKRDTRVRYKLRINRVLNWAIPEVRDYKLALITEICENYDIDGFELDFMRHRRFFDLNETTEAQRVRIMTRFVKHVRAVLDRTARPGQHRWFCVRVPERIRLHGDLGIDLVKWVAAGVDMVNLSCHFVTEQQSDLSRVTRLVPDAAVYLEMTALSHQHRTSDPEAKTDWSGRVRRKMTPEQFYTTAHLAYSRGATGVSLFNFHYYRQYASRGNRTEPPFYVLDRMGDPEWVARQPQHYFTERNDKIHWPARREGLELKPGHPMKITLDMAPPADGWQTGGRLRVQARESFGEQRIRVRLNGVDLEPTPDVSEPYAAPYPDGLGDTHTLRAWNVPADRLRDGENFIGLWMSEGEPVLIDFVDVAVK